MESSILLIFWKNVAWHAENKHISFDDLMNGNSRGVKTKSRNVTLKKIEDIAEKLGIDDYSILFEDYEEVRKWQSQQEQQREGSGQLK